MIKKSFIAMLVLITIFSCSAREYEAPSLSDKDRAELISAFRGNDSTKLTTGRSKESLYEALQKSSLGAAYYYSYQLEQEGQLTDAMRFLLGDMETGKAFRERAAIRYAALAHRGGTIQRSAIDRINTLINSSAADKKSVALNYAAASLNFYSKDYRTAINQLNGLDRSRLKDFNIEQETDFLIALGSAALNLPNNAALLDDFFLNRSPSDATVIAFNWLKEHLMPSDYPHYILYEAMSLSHEGYYTQAFRQANFYLTNNNKLDFLNDVSNFPSQFMTIAARAGQRAAGSDTLIKTLPVTDRETKSNTLLSVGILNRTLGFYSKAQYYVDLAREASLNPIDYDRALWYSLNISQNLYLDGSETQEQFFADLAKAAASWQDNSYYNDILENVLAEFVYKRDFKSAYRLYTNVIKQYGDKSAVADYAWVLAQAIKHNKEIIFYDSTYDQSKKKTELKAIYDGLLSDALIDPLSYAAFMSSAVTKQLPGVLINIPKNDRGFKINGVGKNVRLLDVDKDNEAYKTYATMALGDEPVSDDLYVLGFFYYNLQQNSQIKNIIIKEMEALMPVLSTDAVRLVSREFDRSGDYFTSIAMIYKVRPRADFKPTIEDYKIMYPKAYAQEMEEVTQKAKIDSNIFYGLIRQESRFLPAVSSHVGAVGLAQIMPASADEFSQALGMNSYDLTDPLTNLTFGSYYINWMKNRFDGMYGVLMGYNAGPTRTRRWMREWTDLPSVLAVEAVPYRETRNYVKNILVASSIYGFIYDQKMPAETISKIFPDLL